MVDTHTHIFIYRSKIFIPENEDLIAIQLLGSLIDLFSDVIYKIIIHSAPTYTM